MQGYDPTKPAYKSDLSSAVMRVQLNAINSAHSGPTAPINPQEGQRWLDTTTGSFNIYTSGTWLELFKIVGSKVFGNFYQEDSLLFFEGDFPPDFANIDDYNFSDSASFASGVNRDVIFRITPIMEYQQNGAKIILRYCMSTSHAGAVRLRFDYRVKDVNDPITGGLNYQDFVTFDPVNAADLVGVMQEFIIPTGRITANTEIIHCRFTRLGSNVLDTHTGALCLLGIGIVPNL